MLWFGLFMVFAAFFLLAFGIGKVMTARRTAVERRLEQVSEIRNEELLRDAVMKNGKNGTRDTKKQENENWFAAYLAKLGGELIKADILLRPKEYLYMIALISLLVVLLLYLFTQSFIISILGLLSGPIISKFMVSMKKKQRIAKLNAQLVDTIILISNGLKAGYSFFQASETVARDMRPPMSTEFLRMNRQINLGMTIEEALKKLAERMESPDMDLVVTAILIQRQVGGNLAEILENITNTIRERVMLKREVKSKTAQGRMSGLILGLLPPMLALIINVMNPEFMGILFKNPIGWFIIGFAVFLQIIGVIIINKIIKIEI